MALTAIVEISSFLQLQRAPATARLKCPFQTHACSQLAASERDSGEQHAGSVPPSFHGNQVIDSLFREMCHSIKMWNAWRPPNHINVTEAGQNGLE